ncbi:MAG: division/cell wall cluster transcriptional repressor MraZ [Deltaproteobacteria bacterium]|jgi:MraZ protein|nr:division/cell wall cluster transcriptional repressor MraZ [Deltaproteobacteria bacterium]MBI4795805.1 division/cell wall cluster transcriptional repressor MraZ [Deltaproteobacteria bacterium]
MFTGSYFHLLDNKGRVSISPRYREILQERQDRVLIITNYDGYILAFPQSEWVKVEARLAEQSTLRKEVRAVQRFLISGVQECPLDRQGRILIGPYLRDYAKLSREVALVGMIRCFEIWDRPTYEAHRKQLEASINEEVLHELLI